MDFIFFLTLDPGLPRRQSRDLIAAKRVKFVADSHQPL
jgi:hypothetical protein